eukprot:4274436-Pleurochrysis_carterae.AAC.1
MEFTLGPHMSGPSGMRVRWGARSTQKHGATHTLAQEEGATAEAAAGAADGEARLDDRQKLSLGEHSHHDRQECSLSGRCCIGNEFDKARRCTRGEGDRQTHGPIPGRARPTGCASGVGEEI